MIRYKEIKELEKMLEENSNGNLFIARGFLEDVVTEFKDSKKKINTAFEKGKKIGVEETLTWNKGNEENSYNEGLKDAWELAKKIALNTHDGGIDAKELEAIFGTHNSYTIFKKNDVKEALAKFEAYEKEIEVGDVISLRGVEAVVTCIYPDGTFDGIKITADDKHGRLGGVYAGYHLSSWEKTGNHRDLSAVLAEIGKE